MKGKSAIAIPDMHSLKKIYTAAASSMQYPLPAAQAKQSLCYPKENKVSAINAKKSYRC